MKMNVTTDELKSLMSDSSNQTIAEIKEYVRNLYVNYIESYNSMNESETPLIKQSLKGSCTATKLILEYIIRKAGI